MTADHRAVMLALLQGRTYTVIEQSVGCSSKTISTARKALDAHGWTEADITVLTDDDIAQAFPDRRIVKDDSFAPINISELLARMGEFRTRDRGKKFKLKVEHERYVRQCRQAGTKSYSYSQYTALVAQYVKAHDYSWPLAHEPGHKMFANRSGDKLWGGKPAATISSGGGDIAECTHLRNIMRGGYPVWTLSDRRIRAFQPPESRFPIGVLHTPIKPDGQRALVLIRQ